jgi:hypothetical protein
VLLNIYLDHVLDRWWRKTRPDVPLLRTADDLAILCRSRREAERVYPQLARRLQGVGFDLHGADSSHLFDLRQVHVPFLGFNVQQRGSDWLITLPASFRKRLEHRIHRLQCAPDGLPTAVHGIEGLFSQLGPAFHDADRPQLYGEMTAALTAKGLQAAVRNERWEQLWQTAWMRWQSILARQQKNRSGKHCDDDDDGLFSDALSVER